MPSRQGPQLPRGRGAMTGDDVAKVQSDYGANHLEATTFVQIFLAHNKKAN